MINDIYPVIVFSAAAGAANAAGGNVDAVYPFFASAAWSVAELIWLAVVNS